MNGILETFLFMIDFCSINFINWIFQIFQCDIFLCYFKGPCHLTTTYLQQKKRLRYEVRMARNRFAFKLKAKELLLGEFVKSTGFYFIIQ